jgi:hypothetical protein
MFDCTYLHDRLQDGLGGGALAAEPNGHPHAYVLNSLCSIQLITVDRPGHDWDTMGGS